MSQIVVVDHQPISDALQARHRWYQRADMPLWLCLFIALLLRGWVLIHAQGVLDGDEALVGIQAQHVLQGDYPIYFYGQPHMGSLEAYLIAILFAIFGSSVWTLHTEPLLLSLVVVWLTWKLAHALAGLAHLTPHEQQYFRIIAILLALMAPLYDTVLELHAYGGYVETFVLMLMLLLASVRLLAQWQAGAKLHVLAWYWAGIGGIIGLGFWIDPLIISAIVAVAVWLGGYGIIGIVRWRRTGTVYPWPTLTSLLTGLLAALAALPAAMIGSAPALLWGATHNWENVAFLFQRSGGASLRSIRALAHLYVSCVGPRIISGSLPGESNQHLVLHVLPLALGICCIGVIGSLLGLSLVWHSPFLLRVRRLASLPLLFAISTFLFFCVSWGPVHCTDRDIVGRYATPLMLVLPFFFSTFFISIRMYSHQRASRPRWSEREAQRLPRLLLTATQPRYLAVAYNILWALLIVSLCTQMCAYLVTNAALAFQSPFCRDAPANNEQIISYMQQQHIHYAWSSFWVGNSIIFKTQGRIIVGDPGAIIMHTGNLGRMPQYQEEILHADRPSLLVFIRHSDPHPLLLRVLAARHVIYRAVRFSSEPGIDLLLVTPLNRTVSLLESAAFKTIFSACPSRWGQEIREE